MGGGSVTYLKVSSCSCLTGPLCSRLLVSISCCRLFVILLLHGEPVRRTFQPAPWINPRYNWCQRWDPSVPHPGTSCCTQPTQPHALLSSKLFLSHTLSKPVHRTHCSRPKLSHTLSQPVQRARYISGDHARMHSQKHRAVNTEDSVLPWGEAV